MLLRKRTVLAAGIHAVALGLLALSCSVAAAEEGSLPFRSGETLTYDLRWKFIHAGSAVFTVEPTTDVYGVPARHFVLRLNSSPLLDVFFKVRDRMETYTDIRVTRSLLYKYEQRQGRRSRDITVNFDWERETARYENRGEPREPIFIHPGTLDPLAIAYHIRLQQLVPGEVLMAPITDGKKVVIGRLKVVDRQRVKVPAGEFETFRVEADVRHLGGVFEQSETSRLQIWITADPQRVPVKLSARSGLGGFSAYLVSVETGSAATSMTDAP